MIEQISRFQYSLLRRLANSEIKTYGCPSGVPADDNCDAITEEFNDVLRLVQLGLAVDASRWPKFADVGALWQSEGRDVVIIALRNLGQRMFERTPHDKWRN